MQQGEVHFVDMLLGGQSPPAEMGIDKHQRHHQESIKTNTRPSAAPKANTKREIDAIDAQ